MIGRGIVGRGSLPGPLHEGNDGWNSITFEANERFLLTCWENKARRKIGKAEFEPRYFPYSNTRGKLSFGPLALDRQRVALRKQFHPVAGTATLPSLPTRLSTINRVNNLDETARLCILRAR